jgi:hypothetical protein
MKNLILFTTALLFASQLFSQDILTLRSGVKYQVKLYEITDTELRFKMYNNQGGPFYTISRKTFQSIVYENGVTEEFALNNQESSQTVTVNGYNISSSSSTTFSDESQSTVITQDSGFPSQPAKVAQKKVTFGEVMGAIFATGMIALDVASKFENSKCTQSHQHSSCCRR